MKNSKKIIALFLVAVLTFSLFTLAACDSGEKEYSVNVKDALGNPYTSGLVVKFMKDGKQVAMQSCDENGTAKKTLESGKYDIVLTFADETENYYYDKNIKLTARKNTADVIIANTISAEPKVLYVGNDEYNAYTIGVGCTYSELQADGQNYFLFTPTQAGNYEFSICEGDAEIGYYGAPHFVQQNNVAEVNDNKFTISVSATMIGTGDGGTSTYVIGVDAAKKTTNCVIGIERLGDALKTMEDEPWVVYQKTVELQDYVLPANAEIKEFDLTAASDTYNIVFNENDGYYHLNSENGPLVLARLGEDCKYIACFKTMLDRSGVVKYFYDENDNFVKKESYSECLLEYIEYIDEDTGVYPLTKDLKYIIEQRGDHTGWWDVDSNGYIFKNDDGSNNTTINAEIAWLLMCCYID